MIDYIKISTTDFDHQSLLRHSLLNFSGWTDLETSEIIPNEFGNKKYVGHLHNLKIIVYDNGRGKFTLCILGSIHKFHNKGMHNFDDFALSDLSITIDSLGKLFFFNVENCKIHNLEIGLNIIPPIKTKKILNGLLSHRNERFKSYSIPNAEIYQVIHNNFIFKIYDKAIQYRAKHYNLPNEILRIELKYIKMIDLINLLKDKEILDRNFITLNDLKNIDVLKAFGDLLVKKWSEILFYDCTISKQNLSNLQCRKLTIWQNINQWEQFSKQKKYKQKIILQDVTKNHSQQVQLQISNLIHEKLEILLQKGLPINHSENTKKDYLLTTSIPDGMITERLPINSIYKEVFCMSFEDFFSVENQEELYTNYTLWINDPRKIPF